MSSILLLEDDALFAQSLEEFLSSCGFVVTHLLDPLSAFEITYEQKFDLYILDVNLPYESGFELLKRLRESGDTTPALFLTSRDDKESMREGFEIGADEYIKKPVDLDELLWRVNALLKQHLKTSLVIVGNHTIDTVSKELFVDNHLVKCSQKAVSLLLLLLKYSGKVVTLEQIKDELWSPSQEISHGALRVYVSQLKNYFPDTIENIRGIGYRFVRES